MIQGPSMLFRVPEANAQVPNLNNASQDCKGNNLGQFGSNGYLSFYIAKPVQGEVEIPYTLIATLYASKKKYIQGSTFYGQYCREIDLYTRL
ncbi:fimbrial protein [Escherichia coli DEC1E]|nr:fimbrial protein [Escherichia coli DEC1E]